MANDSFWAGSHEARLSRVEQRVSDLDTRLMSIVPVAATVIQLGERMETLRRDLRSYADQVSKLDEEITEREELSRRERRQARFALYTLSITIFCSLISVAAIVLTGAH